MDDLVLSNICTSINIFIFSLKSMRIFKITTFSKSLLSSTQCQILCLIYMAGHAKWITNITK